MHHFSYRNGFLHCEDTNLESITSLTGTPVYVYSASTITENFRRLDSSLSGIDHEICYAAKANSNLSILHLLAKEGAGFDIVSAGELFRVKKAGGSPSHCTFAGVGKTSEEIRYALEAGIYSFNVESEAELARINQIAASCNQIAPVAIRINPDVDAQTHKFISTGKSKNKFGIGIDRAEAVYAEASRLPHISLRGVQTHIGSQILSTAPFAEAAAKLAPLVKKLKDLYNLEFFSFGGGMGIIYDDALASASSDWWLSRPSNEKKITPEDYAAAIIPHLAPLKMRILFEPGRFLVGNAGVLLSEVQYIKKTPSKHFTVVDAAMNDLIRPALYDGHHQIVPLRESAAPHTIMDVVGPVCESGDFFAQDRELPLLAPGDLIALMSAGAYGFAMSSQYNSRPLLPEVLVKGSHAEIVRPRQSFDDLIANEKIVELT